MIKSAPTQPGQALKPTRKPLATNKLLGVSLIHLLLVALSLTMVLPFIWMVLTSLKSLDEVGLETWLPGRFRWENYAVLFGIGVDESTKAQGIAYGRWYWNSVFVAACVTYLQVVTSSMAAFSFSRLNWFGRDKVFFLYLGTMMLPGLVMMIPNYQVMISLGLIDTYWGLIIPAAFSAFGTFLLRQFMLSIPHSLDEAALIDGASKWRLFWDVILPLSRPGLITLTIFTFIGNFHSFFWPLVMLKSTHRYTLPVGLLFFDSSQGQQTNVLMAAITLSVVPMLVLFVVLQKYLVKGIQLGAVKG
ncbi:MAG: carbohydrate ABC transporter permease [Phycisphaerales bacterium]